MASSSHSLSSLRVVRVFIPFALGYFLSYAFRVGNAIIATDLTVDLHLDAASLGLLTSAYFLPFAVFQLPLGLLLDRFGPRRTEATLLTIAAAGAFLFANAHSLAGLIVGRCLIGLGVSACLMGAFKAYVMWFPANRLPVINGAQMAIGGLGALAATRPIEILLQFISWRDIFVLAGAMALVVAIILWIIVPPDPDTITDSPPQTVGSQGLWHVLSDRRFFSIAPLTAITSGTMMAIQGLWATAWLMDVAELDRTSAANALAAMTAALIAGYLVIGKITEALSVKGITTMTTAVVAMSIGLLPQVVIVAGITHAASITWMAYGFLSSATILTYAGLAQQFPKALAGRVITAQNVCTFLCAFLAQAGLGLIINQWPAINGGYLDHGYRLGFGLMLALQILALSWYLITRRGPQPKLLTLR